MDDAGVTFVIACASTEAPHATALAEEIRRHHPDAALLVTGDFDTSELHPAAESVPIESLTFGQFEALSLLPALTTSELIDVAGPAMLARALDDGARAAVLLAPRIAVIGRVDGLIPEADAIHLAPRVGTMLPPGGDHPDGVDAALRDPYHPGIIGVGRSAREALDAYVRLVASGWTRGLRPAAALTLIAATTQPVRLWRRHLEGSTFGAVDRSQIGTVDVEDLDPETTPHRAPRRADLASEPWLMEILHQRREATAARDARTYRACVRGLEERFDDTMRALYRSAFASLVDGSGEMPPSPMSDWRRFLEWCAELEHAGSAPVSRYVAQVRRGRADLLDAFPEVPGRDARALLEWARTHGRCEGAVPEMFVPPAPPEPRGEGYSQPGVNLAGFLTADLGVGEVARRLSTAIVDSHIPLAEVHYDRTMSRTDERGSSRAAAMPRFDTNIICVNADSLGEFVQELGTEFLDRRHNIGVWFWEASEFPEMFRPAFANVQELWAASDYVADALRRAAPDRVPVIRFPLPIIEPATAELTREQLGLPDDRFIFLVSFDYLSVMDRKNPIGAIEAYKRAFDVSDGALLVVKSINARLRRGDQERVALAAFGRPDIVLRDGYETAASNAKLVAHSDCYVSLHRSEGFGFNIADAMALGTPVIVTAYAGSNTFTSPDDCWLVDYDEVRVGEGRFPYPAHAVWADPDLEGAATLMRQVRDDPEAARARAQRARTRVLEGFSPEVTGRFIRDRLATIRAERTEDRGTSDGLASSALRRAVAALRVKARESRSEECGSERRKKQ
jgi:glycosyltransferase involved in cell wall biosynthesis